MRRKFSLHSGKKRTGVIVFLILLAFALVILRLFWLQIITGNELARRSVRQTTGEEKVYSPRGSILDRNGEELAVSIMSKSLYVDPQQMDDNPELWARGEKPKRDPRRLAADLLAPVLKMKADLMVNIILKLTFQREFIVAGSANILMKWQANYQI